MQEQEEGETGAKAVAGGEAVEEGVEAEVEAIVVAGIPREAAAGAKAGRDSQGRAAEAVRAKVEVHSPLQRIEEQNPLYFTTQILCPNDNLGTKFGSNAKSVS